jgi:organic radical activating enzyme
MWGRNLVSHEKDVSKPGTLLVREIFLTVQGEGPSTGVSAVFVRLGGCNLRCAFCDTDFDEKKSERLTFDRVFTKIRELAAGTPRLLVLTGGEPLLQQPVPYFAAEYLEKFLGDVEIETSGSRMLHQVWQQPPGRVRIICSPKTPRLSIDSNSINYYKYIIQHGKVSEEDGLPIGSTQKPPSTGPEDGSWPPALAELARPPKKFPRSRIYVQPCDEYDPRLNRLNRAAAISSSLKFGYSISNQLHKTLDLR